MTSTGGLIVPLPFLSDISIDGKESISESDEVSDTREKFENWNGEMKNLQFLSSGAFGACFVAEITLGLEKPQLLVVKFYFDEYLSTEGEILIGKDITSTDYHKNVAQVVHHDFEVSLTQTELEERSVFLKNLDSELDNRPDFGRGVVIMPFYHITLSSYVKNRISRSNPLRLIEFCYIMKSVIEGAWCLHEQGICHRDLHDNNIFLNPTERYGRLWIGDFGMALDFKKRKDPSLGFVLSRENDPAEFKEMLQDRTKVMTYLVEGGYGKYLPPEIISFDEDDTTSTLDYDKCDVFAIGSLGLDLLRESVENCDGDMDRQEILANLTDLMTKMCLDRKGDRLDFKESWDILNQQIDGLGGVLGSQTVIDVVTNTSPIRASPDMEDLVNEVDFNFRDNRLRSGRCFQRFYHTFCGMRGWIKLTLGFFCFVTLSILIPILLYNLKEGISDDLIVDHDVDLVETYIVPTVLLTKRLEVINPFEQSKYHYKHNKMLLSLDELRIAESRLRSIVNDVILEHGETHSEVISLKNDLAVTMFWIGNIYGITRNTSSIALHYLENGLQYSSNDLLDSHFHSRISDILTNDMQYEEAFERAITAHFLTKYYIPDSHPERGSALSWSFKNVGNMYSDCKGDYGRAIDRYNESLHYLFVKNCESEYCMKMRPFKKAQIILNRGIVYEKKGVESELLKGGTRLMDWELAIRDFESVVTIFTEHYPNELLTVELELGDAYLHLAGMYSFLGNHSLSDEYFEKCENEWSQIWEDFPYNKMKFKQWKAVANARNGSFSAVEKFFRECEGIVGNHTIDNLSISELYEDMGDCEVLKVETICSKEIALGHYQKALFLKETSGVPHYHPDVRILDFKKMNLAKGC